jgi:antirestriction protein
MSEIKVQVFKSEHIGFEIDPDDHYDRDDFMEACQEKARELMGADAPKDEDGEPVEIDLTFSDPDDEFPAGMVDTFDVEEDLWEWLKLDDDDQKMVKTFRDDEDMTESVERIMERYQGTFRNEAEWAEDYAEQTGLLDSMPENLRSYFDFESFARDCRMGGDVSFVDGGKGVYVFNNH